MNGNISMTRETCAAFYDFERSCVERYPGKGAYQKLAESFRLAAYGTDDERRKALEAIDKIVCPTLEATS